MRFYCSHVNEKNGCSYLVRGVCWLGIVIQQLVPHTGNEIEEVRVGGARSGFTGVIPHLSH